MIGSVLMVFPGPGEEFGREMTDRIVGKNCYRPLNLKTLLEYPEA